MSERPSRKTTERPRETRFSERQKKRSGPRRPLFRKRKIVCSFCVYILPKISGKRTRGKEGNLATFKSGHERRTSRNVVVSNRIAFLLVSMIYIYIVYMFSLQPIISTYDLKKKKIVPCGCWLFLLLLHNVISFGNQL